MSCIVRRLITVFWVFLVSSSVSSWAAKSFETKQWVTKNGTKVVFYQAMDVPMLDISLAFAAGSAYDGSAFGLSALTTRLLNQGSKGLDASAIAEELAETGAQYTSATNQDMAVLKLRTLTKPDSLEKACRVFADIIRYPDFSKSAFLREKNQQLMAIAQKKESPDVLAEEAFFQALYQTHPYAHPVMGDAAHVRQLELSQVHDFYHRFFVGQNAIMVLVGAIEVSKARALSERVLQDLPKGRAADPIPEAQPLKKAVSVRIPFPASQTVVRMGQLGISHHNPNYFPLLVGNYILGGGSLVSQLATELREKRGLTYHVTSAFAPMPGRGPFSIGLSTKNNQADTAIEITEKTLTDFLKLGPSTHELQAAKKYLVGSFPLTLAGNQNIAAVLLGKTFYHLPEDYLDTYTDRIQSVTVEHIKTAMQALIKPNAFLQVRVGKPS